MVFFNLIEKLLFDKLLEVFCVEISREFVRGVMLCCFFLFIVS